MNSFQDLNLEHIRGFLSPDESRALYDIALSASQLGPILEIGSYCGKSTLCLGLAAQLCHNSVFAIDHHRGSEEHQPGELFHEPSLFDPDQQAVDTFKEFRHNVANAGLNDTVIPIVAESTVVARHWQTSLGMLFIDGGHSLDSALNDYRRWSRHIVYRGILAIHDVYPNPGEGGQAPASVYQLAVDSGQFSLLDRVGSLVTLQRL